MIRISVPIDLDAVVLGDSAAFALATPLRVRSLISMAVQQVLGPRAPQDKRDRTLASTLAGIANGSFVVDINGRRYTRADEVVVCAGVATLRFFLRRSLSKTH